MVNVRRYLVVVVGGLMLATGGLAAEPVETALHRPGKGLAWGYQGDGSAVIDATPPVKFTEKDIRWKAPMPACGHATPVIVGERVFVTTEVSPEAPWPVLMCLSVADGKVLWKAELNHLPASKLSAAQQAEADKLWRATLTKYGVAQKLRGESKTDDELAKKLNDAGIEGTASVAGGYWSGRMRPPEYKQLTDKRSPLTGAGLSLDTWWLMGNNSPNGGWRVGEAFATPISDGKSIYAVTAWGGVFCFDLEGKLTWLKHVPGAQGEYCRNGRSPVIYKDLLIVDATSLLRAFDRKTGELKWSAPLVADTITTPTVITTGGHDVLLVSGKALQAFSLPDGKELPISGWSNTGLWMLTKYDEPDVVFFNGGGEHGGWAGKGHGEDFPPAAVRFTLEGDKLSGKALWQGVDGKGAGSHTALVYHDGKLYHTAGVIDAKTGKVLVKGAGKGRTGGAVPGTGHLLYVANGHVFGVRCEAPREGGKSMLRYGVSTVDGKPVGDSQIEGYNYSHAFALAGDAVFIRSVDALYCIGPAK